MTIEKKTCIKFCTIVAFCLQIYRHVLYANQPLQFVKSPLCTKTKTFLQQKKEMEKWCNCEKFRLCNCTRKKHVVEEVEGENSTRQPPCWNKKWIHDKMTIAMMFHLLSKRQRLWKKIKQEISKGGGKKWKKKLTWKSTIKMISFLKKYSKKTMFCENMLDENMLQEGNDVKWPPKP